MLYKQNLYVIKTTFICCRDKKLGARAERARRGFFPPKKRHSYFLRTQYSCLVGPEGLRRHTRTSKEFDRGGGGRSILEGAGGHGEDNRRGRGQITSHTPGDPVGVGGLIFEIFGFFNIWALWSSR